mgnify:CR=1 FL=1
MKTLIKIILLFLVISLLWHASPMSSWQIAYSGDLEAYDWIVANALIVGVVFFAVALVLVVFLSLFTAIVFFAGLVCATMLFLGLSFMWPALLFGLVLYWAFSDRKTTSYEN